MKKNPKLEKTSCPKCANKLDAATSVELKKIQPKPNDVSICAYCSSILIYKSDLSLEEATRSDLIKLDMETLILLMKSQLMIQIQRKGLPKKKQNLFPPIS